MNGENEGLSHSEEQLRKLREKVTVLETLDQYRQSLLRLAGELQKVHTYQDITKVIQPEILNLLGYQMIWLFLFYEDRKAGVFVTVRGTLADQVMETLPRLEIVGDPYLEAVAAATDILVIEDARTDPRTNKEIVAQLQNRTLVNVPLWLVDERLGVFGMGSFGDEGIIIPTPGQIEYLKTLAYHVAVAVERTQFIMQRQEQARALQESEERYRLLVEQAPVAIAVYYGDMIAYLNPAGCELLGVPDAAAILGTSMMQYIHPDSLPLLQERQRRLPQEGRLEPAEEKIIRPDGETRDIEVITSAIRYKDKPAVMVIAQDITQRKQMAAENARLYAAEQERAEALLAALARQQELDRLKDEFLQNSSHELRTPLTVAMGYVDMVADENVGELQATQRMMLKSAQSRLYDLYQIVMGLTTLAVSGGNSVYRDQVHLTALVQDIVQDFQALAAQNDLTLHTNIEPDLPPLSGNPIHLGQLVDNLLSNAVKFTPKGGTITVRLFTSETGLVLEVIDTGIGVAPEQMERIFERFYQVDGSATRRYGGAGLGLALVKEIAEAHRGRVSVTSAISQGSTFRVEIPL